MDVVIVRYWSALRLVTNVMVLAELARLQDQNTESWPCCEFEAPFVRAEP